MNKPKVRTYKRTSRKDKHPELQENDIQNFCNQKGFEIIDPIEEKGSAYLIRDKRKGWLQLIEKCRQDKSSIVLWRYDRAFRNAKEFTKFMIEMYEVYGIKVYSVQETWVNDIWDATQDLPNNIPEEWRSFLQGILKQTWRAMVNIVGKAAQDESDKKSQRTKLAVVRKEGEPTKSYKGKLWGKKSLITDKIVNEVLQLNKQGLSLREISQRVFYWDIQRNKHNLSKSAVHNILQRFSDKDFVNNTCPNKSDLINA
jgi:DNA invertase Pin-like site-specific DNA recombinase